MRYPILTNSDASLYLSNRREGNQIDLETLVKTRGGGPDLSQAFVPLLSGAISTIRDTFPDGIRNDNLGNLFEAKAARIVHSQLKLDYEILADPDFWTWLSVMHFSDAVEWRYKNPTPGTALANYGIGARSENLLYRIWLRAELVLDDGAADRYHLSDRGQVDFYRSHLFRQSYANVQSFSRALIRFQYPDEVSPSKPFLKLLQIRDLVKRLKRLRYNLFVELLDEEECYAVIRDEADRLPSASG